MARININVGSAPNDGTGDSLRDAFVKVNTNFVELYDNDAADTLDAITTLGNTTTNSITVGGLIVDTDTLYVDSTNNRVGIGTDSPSAKLHINPDANSNYVFTGSSTSGYTTTFNMNDTGAYIGHNSGSRTLNFQTNSADRLTISGNGDISFRDTSTNEAFYWDASAAYLGIGTGSTPNAPLHISSASSTKAVFERTGSTGSYIGLKDSSGSLVYLGDNNGTFEVQTAGSSYSTKLAVTSSGDVGIGTDTPAAKLHIDNGEAIIATNTDGLKLSYSVSNSSGIIDTAFSDNNLEFRTNGTAKMWIANGGNVGINQTSPSSFFSNASQLVIGDGSTSRGMTIYGSSAGDSQIFFADGTTGDQQYRGIFRYEHSSDSMVMFTSATERMRITSVGDVEFYNGATKYGSIVREGASDRLILNSDNATGYLAVDGTILYRWKTNGIVPHDDNVRDLGEASLRYDDVYATNGTIQTSDLNQKQDIQELNDAEQRVAISAKGLLRKFRWKSSVEEKGDNARIHFGIIAQDLKSAFEAENLNANDYGMFIESHWTDEDGNEQTTLGVRYSELLAFIISTI